MKNYLKLLIIVSVLILIMGCEIKKFVMPTWDVEFNVPLINTKYFVADLIDSVSFFPAPNNGIIFETSGDLLSTPIGEISMSISDEPQTIPILSGIQIPGAINFEDNAEWEVSFGLVSSGTVLYRFTDMSPSVTLVYIEFPDIINDSGEPVRLYYNQNQNEQVYDVAGFYLGAENSNTIINQLNFVIVAQSSQPSGTEIGTLMISVPEELHFSKFKGVIRNLSIEIEDNNQAVEIEYPFGIDEAISLTNAKILLHIENPVSFPCILNGEFVAKNEHTGVEISVNVLNNDGLPYIINPSVNNQSVITEIIFDSNVNELLSIMPTQIAFKNAGYTITSPDNTIGEIQSSDVITGTYIIHSPLDFVVYDSMIEPKDSLKIEISSENIETIKKNINNASLQVYVINKLPIGAEANLYFGTDPNLSPSNPDSWILYKSAHIAAVTSPVTEQIITLCMTKEELELFTNETVYMRQTFHFDASNGPVSISASPADYIHLRSMIKVNTHIVEQK